MIMRIGITYDTREMYAHIDSENIYFDFADSHSINCIKRELQKLGCKVTLVGNADNLATLILEDNCNFDLIYNTVEGICSRNREGLVPALLEVHKIPYAGTDSFGVSFSLNKFLTKMLASQLDISTPNYCIFGVDADNFEVLKDFKFPVILKPNFEGNSSGICICDTYAIAQRKILELIKSFKTDILCEEFIFGKEITVPIIGNDSNTALWGITSVDAQTDDSFWLDINLKIHGDYNNIMLTLPPAVELQIKEASFRLFNAIGCSDFARFDFRLASDNTIYFIEANPLPCLFRGGSFDIVGQKYGLNYSNTLKLIINTACERLSIPKI